MPPSDLSARAAALNARFRHLAATDVLAHALREPALRRIALVSSFGAESAVLLHMLSLARRDTPVIFIDTRLLFAETLVYQETLAERLGLSDVRIIRASKADLARHDPDGGLHRRDPDACCALRKTAPLEAALAGFGGWISGRKRFQGLSRERLDVFEPEPGTGRIKINPLAHWRRSDVQDYLEENRLPRHPLVSRGYPSIGCIPCTSTVARGEDIRAGRWRGQAKTECGIHFAGGQAERMGVNA